MLPATKSLKITRCSSLRVIFHVHLVIVNDVGLPPDDEVALLCCRGTFKCVLVLQHVIKLLDEIVALRGILSK